MIARLSICFIMLIACINYSCATMTHEAALKRLTAAGITIAQGCNDKKNDKCISLDGVLESTVTGLEKLKSDSRCGIVIVGGTEAGHSPGPISHGSGHMVEITRNSCVDNYIKNQFQSIGKRGDGAPMFKAPTGTTFADEGRNWDIAFR